MREMSQKLAGGLEDPKFTQSVQDIEDDLMVPALKKLQRDITGVSALKARLSEARIDFTTGFLGAALLRGDLPEALLVGTVGALVKALVKLTTSREKTRPAASMVYSFHTGRWPTLSLDVSLRALGNALRARFAN
jgi:hypothetical protein